MDYRSGINNLRVLSTAIVLADNPVIPEIFDREFNAPLLLRLEFFSTFEYGIHKIFSFFGIAAIEHYQLNVISTPNRQIFILNYKVQDDKGDAHEKSQRQNAERQKEWITFFNDFDGINLGE